MGVVYLARQHPMGRRVVVKLIRPELVDPDSVQRFEQEVTLASALDHQNIVHVYRAGMYGRAPYVVMQFVDGPDLGRLIEMHGRLTAQRAVHVTRQLAAALDAAHSQGIIHRDLKPENVLVRSDQTFLRVLLADFGLATVVGQTRMTQAGTPLGTPVYMAPEQWLGRGTDARTDVYALAATLFAMLAGRPPYLAKTMDALRMAHMEAPPPNLARFAPDAPPQLGQVIAKGLAKSPDARFASAGELARAAAAVVNVKPQLSPGKRHPLAKGVYLALIGIGATRVVAGAAKAHRWYNEQRQETEPTLVEDAEPVADGFQVPELDQRGS